MAYKKTNWQDTLRDAQGNVIQKGTPLNAQALGKIEDGIVAAEQKIDNEISQVTTQLAQIGGIQRFGRGTKFIAHAGVNQASPESSLPSFIYAGKVGYKYLETDIHETSDGVFVCMHDTTVDRTTNGTGLVANMTFAQIQQLNLDMGANIGYFPNLKVPTLEQFLIVCLEYDMVPIIEFKPTVSSEAQAARLNDIILKYNIQDSAQIISFNFNFLRYIRAINKNITLQILGDADNSVFTFAKEITNGVGCQQLTLTKQYVDMCHSANLFVNAWTVDSHDRASELASWGVDFITTNKVLSVGAIK